MEEKFMYNPEPIETKNVTLPKELLNLTELLAKNTHDVWAANRIEEGWIYGKEKSSEKKTTPCLVPYDELSESEKEYDRNTALETIKVILKMGYKIEGPKQYDK